MQGKEESPRVTRLCNCKLNFQPKELKELAIVVDGGREEVGGGTARGAEGIGGTQRLENVNGLGGKGNSSATRSCSCCGYCCGCCCCCCFAVVAVAVAVAAVVAVLHFRAVFKCKSLGRFCELTI